MGWRETIAAFLRSPIPTGSLKALDAAVVRSTTKDELTEDILRQGSVAWAETSAMLSDAKYNPDDLIGRKGFDIYKRMLYDEQVKSVMYFKRSTITGREWYFELDHERYGISEKEAKRRVEVCDTMFQDGNYKGTFVDGLNSIMKCMWQGFSMTEKNFGQFSHDGRMYWGLREMRPKPFDSFYPVVNDKGDVLRWEQRGGPIGARNVVIDLAKFVYYRYNPDVDEHYGGSDLRAAYRSFLSKDISIRYRNIYMERFAAGFAVMKPVDGHTIVRGSPEWNALTSIMMNLSGKSSILLPEGVDFELKFAGGNAGSVFKEAIEQDDQAIARAALVPNLLGVAPSGQTGSYSQSDTQFDVFMIIANTEALRLQEALNEQIFAPLGKINFPGGIAPKLCFKPLSKRQQAQMVTMWQQLVSGKAVQASESDEAHLRKIMEFPEKGELLTDPAAPSGPPTSAPRSPQGVEEDDEPAAPTGQGEDSDKDRDKRRAKMTRRRKFHGDPDDADYPHGEGGGGTSDDELTSVTEAKSPPFVQDVMKRYPSGKELKGYLESLPTDKLEKARELIKKHNVKTAGARYVDSYVEEVLAERRRVRNSRRRFSPSEAAYPRAYDATIYEQKRLQDLEQEFGPKIPVDRFFRQRAHLSINRDEVLAAFEPTNEDFVISMEDIIPTQEFVDAAKLLDMLGAESLPLPKVMQQGKQFFLLDGHHRVVVESLRGQWTLRVVLGRFERTESLTFKRELSRAQQRVAFAVIGRQADAEQLRYVDQLEDSIAEVVAEAVSRIEQGGVGGRDSGEEIGKFTLDGNKTRSVESVVRRTLQSGMTIGNAHSKREVEAARGKGFSRRFDMKRLGDMASDWMRQKSFTIAGDLKAGITKQVKNALTRGLKQNWSHNEVKQEIYRGLVNKGILGGRAATEALGAGDTEKLAELLEVRGGLSPHHLDTVVRTNMFEAINEARLNTFTDPEMGDFVIGLEYSAILDGRTTTVCDHMDGRAYSSAQWQDELRPWVPPNHFNCRSILVPITQLDEDQSLDDELPKIEPQEGF